MSEFNSDVGGKHSDWGGWQKLIVFRLDEQDRNISDIKTRLKEVNEVRESQHTENKVAMEKLNGLLTPIAAKVNEIENLKKWLTLSILGALLTAVLNLIIRR